jgi:thioredoxin-related protein
MIRSVTLPLALALTLSSCSMLGLGKKKEEAPSPFGPTGIPPELRVKNGDSGTAVEGGGNIPAGPSALNFTPSEDIVYTDPDNPEATIPELATLLSGPKRGPWEESETIAKQRSLREGKPLLIWFTDSQRSPMCKALSQELFSTNDFGNWATEKMVRLKVDAVVDKEDMRDMDSQSADDYRARVTSYNTELKKRYKVMGYPALVVLSPSGEVIGQYRGYKRGDAQFVWGQLKQAEAVSAESYKSWRIGMEKKGYREWEDRRSRKIFAKLVSYSNGELVLIEPNGSRARTKEASLSDKDKAWIAEQKKLRSIR